MAGSDRDRQQGEPDWEPFLDYFVTQSVSPFVDIAFVIQVRTSVLRLLEKAKAQDNKAVNTICRALAEDLLANPRPTPQVMRGFLVNDLLRATGFKPSSIWERKRRRWEWIRTLIAVIRTARKVASYPLEDYFRYELKKHADAYVALFENDYKSVQSAVGAIASVSASAATTFQDAKRAFSSLDSKNREMLIQSIHNEGCEVVLEPHDDRHLRNALVHGSYSIESDILRFKDRDFQEQLALLDFIGKLMRLRVINEVVAYVLV